MGKDNNVDIVLRSVDRASAGIKKVNKELGDTGAVGKKTSVAMKMLGTAVAGIGFLALAKQAGTFTLEATKLSARVETLGVVTSTLGRNAGYTTTEIRVLERAIQAQGITTEKSRQSLALMMQANMDLADSTDLARLAQDAAVIAGIDSSQAFERLVTVITTGSARMARTMGIQVNFNQAYEKMAENLGVTKDALTEQQKVQARSDAVMKQGAQIAGTYAAAMDTVGKQLQSTPRYWNEFKVAFGDQQVSMLGKLNLAWQGFLETSTDSMNVQNMARDAEEAGLITKREMRKIIRQVGDGTLDTTEKIEELTDAMDAQAIATDNDAEALMRASDGMRALTSAEIAAGQATSDVTEKQLRLDQILAIGDGDYEKATRIGEQIALLENQNSELDELIAKLDALDGTVINYSVVGSSSGSLAGGTGISTLDDITDPPKPKPKGLPSVPFDPRARGGRMAPVSLVGEAGPELIVHGQVVPATQTARMLRAGVRPGSRHSLGGHMGGQWASGDSYDPVSTLVGGDAYHGWLDPSTGARHDGSSAAEATSSLSAYLDGGTGSIPSGSAGSSAPKEVAAPVSIAEIAASTESTAASVGVQMAQVITSELGKDADISNRLQSEMLVELRKLPKIEDMVLAFRNAVEQAVM